MKVPRVTEILKPYSGYDKVPSWVLENAAARGTTVHSICAGLAKGHWIPDPMINERLQGYVKSFRMWSEANVKSFEIVEERYQDAEMIYTGQIDAVVRDKDDLWHLVDLKTSAKPQKTHPIQMAAYKNLLNKSGVTIQSALLVYLDKDGDFPLVQQIEDFTTEFRIFQGALECWHYFNDTKKHIDKDEI